VKSKTIKHSWQSQLAVSVGRRKTLKSTWWEVEKNDSTFTRFNG